MLGITIRLVEKEESQESLEEELESEQDEPLEGSKMSGSDLRESVESEYGEESMEESIQEERESPD